MPVTAADVPAIEEALHSGAAAEWVRLADGEELAVKVVRPKANAGRGARSLRGCSAVDGTAIQFNEHDTNKKGEHTELAKSGRRVTWVLVGKFRDRAAVEVMVDGKLSKPVPALPGAVVEAAGDGNGCALPEALAIHAALHSGAAGVDVAGEALTIFANSGKTERRCVFRGVTFRQQAANGSVGGKEVEKTGCQMTWIEVKGGPWGQIVDAVLKKPCSFVVEAEAAGPVPAAAASAAPRAAASACRRRPASAAASAAPTPQEPAPKKQKTAPAAAEAGEVP